MFVDVQLYLCMFVNIYIYILYTHIFCIVELYMLTHVIYE